MERNQTNGSADPHSLFSAFNTEIQEVYPRVASNSAVRNRLRHAKCLLKDARRREDTASVAAHLEAVQRYQPFINKKKPACKVTMDQLCEHTRQLLTSLISHYVLSETWNEIEGATDKRMLLKRSIDRLQSRNFANDVKIEMIDFFQVHGITTYPEKFTPIVEDVIERLRREIP